jgi:hypothetical protein
MTTKFKTQVSCRALFAVGFAAGGVTVWRRQREDRRSRGSSERLNWFHSVMSQANRLILRRPNPCELLKGVCRVCVDAGHLNLAVVDMLDARELHRVSADGPTDRIAATTPQLCLMAHCCRR